MARSDHAADLSVDGALPKSLTYHEPCHLANVQGVRRQPRALLARLKNQGVDVRELNDPTRCCGSAGIYNLTHPAMSKDLLDRKMEDVGHRRRGRGQRKSRLFATIGMGGKTGEVRCAGQARDAGFARSIEER